MAENSGENVRVERIAQDGDECEKQEEEEVESEEDVGDYIEPVGVVGELMQHDGYDACAHGDDEPSGR